MSHHDGSRAARTNTLHEQQTLRPMPPFKMYTKIKRAKGEKEPCTGKAECTKLHDQHTLRPMPPFKMFMKI